MSPSYAAKAASSSLIIGPHCLLTRGGVTLNDRSGIEGYWVEDFTGFDSSDLRVSAQENVQEDGELPDPGFHGGRTMTLTGFIRAGNYLRYMDLARALLDSMISLNEIDMTIATDPGSMFLVQPDVTIACRPADKPVVDVKLAASDLNGVIRRPFTIALRASDPTYKGTTLNHVSIVPTVVSTLGRVYDRTYDLVYTTTLDPDGNPATGANTATAHNDGNYDARPIVRFNGYMTQVILVNATNGDTMILKDPVLSGDYIEIDIAAGTIVDSLGNNKASTFDTRSDWMTLQGTIDRETGLVTTGDNLLQLSVSSFSDSPSVDVWWKDTSI